MPDIRLTPIQPSASNRRQPQVRIYKPRLSGTTGTGWKPDTGAKKDDGFSIGDIFSSIGSGAGYVGSVLKGIPALGAKLGQTAIGMGEFALDTALDVPTLFGAPEFYKSRFERDYEKAEELGLSGVEKLVFASQRQYPIFGPIVEGNKETAGSLGELATLGLADFGEPGFDYYNALKRGQLGAKILEDLGNVVMVGRAAGLGSVTAKAGGRIAAAGAPKTGAALTVVGRVADEPIGASLRGAAGLGQRAAGRAGLTETGAALGRIAQAVPGEAPTIAEQFRSGVTGQPVKPQPGLGVGPVRQGITEVVDARANKAFAEIGELQNQINGWRDQREKLPLDSPEREALNEKIAGAKKDQEAALRKTQLPKVARRFITTQQQTAERRRTVLQTEIANVTRDGFVRESPETLRNRAANLREQAAALSDADVTPNERLDNQQRLNDFADYLERQADVKEANPQVLDQAPPSWVSPATVILLTNRASVVRQLLEEGRSLQDIADLLTPIEVTPDLQMKGYRFTAEDVEAAIAYGLTPERAAQLGVRQLTDAERLMIDMLSVLYSSWYRLFNDARLRGAGGTEPLPWTYAEETPDPKFVMDALKDGQYKGVRENMFPLLDEWIGSLLVELAPEIAAELKIKEGKYNGLFKKLAAREYNDPLFALAHAAIAVNYDLLLERFPELFRNEMIYPAPQRPRIIAQNRVMKDVRGDAVVTLLQELDDVLNLAGDLIGKRTLDSLRRKQQELAQSPNRFSKKQWEVLRSQVQMVIDRLRSPELRAQIEQMVNAAELAVRDRGTKLIEAEQRLGAIEATLRQIAADPEAFLGLKEPEGVLRPIEEPAVKESGDVADADLLATLRSLLAETDPIIERAGFRNQGGQLPGLYNYLDNYRQSVENARRRLAEQRGFETREAARLQALIDEYQGKVDKTLEQIAAIVGDLGDPELIAFISNRANLVDIFRQEVEARRLDLEQEKQFAEQGGRDAKYGTPEELIAAAESELADAIYELDRYQTDLDNALLDLRDAGLSPRLASAVGTTPGLTPVDPTNASRITELENNIAEANARIDEQRALLESEPTPEPAAEAPAPRPAEPESAWAMSARMDEESRLRGNLGLSTNRLTKYDVVAAEAPTPAQVTKLASGMQAGTTFVEFVGPDGQTWLINHPTPYVLYTTENSARTIKLKASPFDGPYPATESANTIIRTAKEKLDAESPETLEAKTATPIAQIKQTRLKNTRSSAVDSTTDIVVFNIGGRLVFVNGRLWAGISKAHPNARFIQLEENKLIIAVDGDKIVGGVMPLRIETDATIDVPTPDDFLQVLRGEITPRLTAAEPVAAPRLTAPETRKVDRAAAERIIADAEATIAASRAELDALRTAPAPSAPAAATRLTTPEPAPTISRTEIAARLRSRLKGTARVEQANLPDEGKAPVITVSLLKTPRTRAEARIDTAVRQEAKAQETLRIIKAKHAALDEAPGMAEEALVSADEPLRLQEELPFGPQLGQIEGEKAIYLPGGTTAAARGGRNLATELRTEGMAAQTLASYEKLRETDLMPLSLTEVGQRMAETLSAMDKNDLVQQVVMDPRFATNAAQLFGAERLEELQTQARKNVEAQSRMEPGDIGLVRTQGEIDNAVAKEFGALLAKEIDRAGYEPVSPVRVDEDGTSAPLGDLLTRVGSDQIDHLTILMRKGLAQQITQQFVVKDSGSIPPKVKAAFDKVGRLTAGWKSVILPFSFRWQVGDAVSNVLMAWTRGDIPPGELWKSMRDVVARLKQQEGSFFKSLQGSISDPAMRTLIAAGLQARGLQLSDLAVLRSGIPGADIEMLGLKGPFKAFRNKMFRVNEFHNTIARLSVGMKKLSDTLEAQGRSIDEVTPATYLSDPVLRSAIDDSVKQTNEALGAFSELSPFEKNVVRQVWPFWSWIKFINKAAVQMAIDNPERVLLMANLGAMALEDEDTGLFEFLQGQTPIQGFLFDLSYLNPYQDAILFQPNIIKALQDQLGSISPVITTPAKAAQIVAYYATGSQQIPFGEMTRPGYLEGRPGASTRTFGDMLGELGYLGLKNFGGPFRNVLKVLPDEIPIIAPQGRLLGTDVAIGNRMVYPQGSARTQGQYAKPRLGPVASRLSALGLSFGMPVPTAQLSKVRPQSRLQQSKDTQALLRRIRERRAAGA